MEPAVLSSDDSCDSEIKTLKNELIEFGMGDEQLTKDEMKDLLVALKNSKSTEIDEEAARTNCDSNTLITNNMKRNYKNVRDRRLPWSLFSKTLTQVEKAKTLAVYIKLMSINTYHQARRSARFTIWPPPLQIVEETTRVLPLRSTRSGRSVPVYADFDDDSTDLDFVITKSKRRKISTSDQNGTDGVFTNKILSLKRKPAKDDNSRPIKEAKMSMNDKQENVANLEKNVKLKKDLFTLIED